MHLNLQGETNISLSIIGKSSGKKNREIYMGNLINNVDLKDICKTLNAIIWEYGRVTKINQILGHKAHINKFQKISHSSHALNII